MRRAVPAAVLVLALAATAGNGSGQYRVDAIFSNAAGLIPGQNVEIAGAVVGQVKHIELTPQHRARVELSLETGFAPFHADATCEIKPQSLIGEKFVECDPGTPDAAQLPGATVGLAHTHAPIDLDLIFAALRRPYVERLSLVVDELGTGLAGRPHDLQLAIKRANPALEQTDRVLALVDRDRGQLGRLIERTDAVLAQLAPRDRDVARFIDRAGSAGAAVAARRDALGRSVDRLPRLLDQLRPSADSLAGVARDARPVVHELSAATPELRALLADLGPLTPAGRPALRALRSASDDGRAAVKAARPVAARLRPVARLIPHTADLAAQLTASLRATKGVEGLQEFAWLGAASMARFDATSHIVPSYQVAGPCQQYATKPLEGCSAHWASYPDQGSPLGSAKRARRAHTRGHRRHRSAQQRPQPSAPAPPPPSQPQPLEPLKDLLDRLPPPPALPPAPKLPGAPHDDQTRQLLDYLLGR